MKSAFYLKSLNLNNFVTFKNKNIDFANSFNAIVGETGSGKSLILDALQLVFGSRSDKKLIRKGCEFCSIEAIFHCEDTEIKNFFDENGYPFEGDEINIKRLIYQTGKSKAFINFQNANIQNLLKFSRRYVDIVGQFENQKLLSSAYQLKLLDNYAGLNILKDDYISTYFQYKSLIAEKSSLKEQKKTKEQRIDYLEFQLNELNELDPSLEDFEKLSRQKELLKNSSELTSLKNNVQELTNSDYSENNVLAILNKLVNLHNKNQEMLPKDSSNLLYEAIDLISQYQQQIDSLEDIQLSEEEVNIIIDRLDKYTKLQNKFSCDVEELNKVREEFTTELKSLTNFTQNFSDLNKRIKELENYLFQVGKKLSQKRRDASTKLAKDLTKSIQSLRMHDATIRIDITQNDTLTEHGLDTLEIFAETNPGEGFYKLTKVASGGELSRILLSFRKILSSRDTISIFLFDEIDTGIGGETALCIGNDLSNVSKNSQVIAITHLPQIANYAFQIINVEKRRVKEENEVRTFSDVTMIGSKDKEAFVKAMNPLN